MTFMAIGKHVLRFPTVAAIRVISKMSPIKVLHVGPGRRSRGGISSVINAYMKYPQDDSLRFARIETQDDRSYARKLLSLCRAYLRAPVAIGLSDVVHVHTASRNSWRRKRPIVLLARLMGKRLVIHIHGGGFRAYLDAMSPRTRALNLWLLKRADCVICLSPRKLEELRPYLGNVTSLVVPNPCLCMSNGSDAEKPQAPTILFTGWVEKEKGVFDLLHAFSIMVHDPAVADARLVIAGKGRVDECRDLAGRLHIADKVELPGWLEGEALLAAYSRAHVYCLPSYIEGVPMAILEAMAFGLPIVTTRVGGIPDVVDEGIHCLFVQPGDLGGIAAALRRLVDNEAEREAMGTASRKRVLSRYSLERIYPQLGQLYHSLMGGQELQPA